MYKSALVNQIFVAPYLIANSLDLTKQKNQTESKNGRFMSDSRSPPIARFLGEPQLAVGCRLFLLADQPDKDTDETSLDSPNSMVFP